MRTSVWTLALCLLGSVTSSLAQRKFEKPPGVKAQEHSLGTYYNGTFDQPIDHFNLSRGTFQNRFFFSNEYWKEPGSPVFLFMVGEENAAGYTGFLENYSIPGMYAEKFGGLVIVIEHRYWGTSLPVDTLTAETLQYLDLPQAMLDIVNFAQNVSFQLGEGMPMNDNADNAPWVLIGGSYPGALTAWISQLFPGVFHAYHASSAVVQTQTDFSAYFKPVTEGLPANCSADVRAVVQHVDQVLDSGSDEDIAALKKGFGLQYLDHHDDFADQISTPLRQWQGNQSFVLEFCDYLELGDDGQGGNSSANARGVGLSVALSRYQEVIKEMVAPTCAQRGNTECNSYVDLALWNDPHNFDADRQWDWLVCHNPFGWFQVGPDVSDGTNIISKYVTLASFTRQCALWFPPTNGYMAGLDMGFTPEHLDLYTGGWDADFQRVLFVNGELDPWRDVTVSSDSRPGGRRASTDDMPIFVLPDSNHCPEMLLPNYEGDHAIYDEFLEIMGTWLAEWEAK